MTVLHLISSGGYYGAETMLLNLITGMADLGYDPAVAIFRNEQNPHTEVGEQALRRGLPVEVIECSGRWDRSAVNRVRECAERRRATVLHTHGYKADLYGLAALRGRLPLVATCHNWTAPTLAVSAYEVLDRLALTRFDKVVAVSDAVARTLRRWGTPAARIAKIPNGIDTTAFSTAAEARRTGVTFGFAGRILREKGVPQFLEAAQRILAVNAGLHFTIAGDGAALEDMKALAARLGMNDAATFIGRQTDMAAVYAAIDVLVLPSLNEGLPMTILEAMAAGKPVIATRVGDVPRVVRHGETGLLVDPGDVEGLTAAMQRLAGNAALRSRLGLNGRQLVRAEYSARSMAERYVEIYREAGSLDGAAAYA